MIHFPLLRTRRLTVQLRELSIGESIAVAAMPPHLEEAATTAFLRLATASAKGVEDPSHWTVQERMLAVCHYLAATAEDGPDFALGDGRYSDYLDGAADIQTQAGQLEAGTVGGDTWHIRHMTGAMAESIERTEGEVRDAAGHPLSKRLHWILGAMAAQMVRSGESVPGDDTTDGAFDEFLLARMKIMAAFPESDFAALMALYFTGREKLRHLFGIEFTGDGIVAMPKGGGAANLPPARFQVHACLTRMAHELVGKPDEPGR
jgi:hypothetical protein